MKSLSRNFIFKKVVAYKETPQSEAIEEIDFERKIGAQKHHVELTLAVYPMSQDQQNSKPTLKFKLANNDLKPFEIKALENGFSNGLYSGPLLGFPILGADFEIKSVNIASRTSETMIAAAMRDAIKKVLKKANTCLMEPMMKLTIHAEPEVVGSLISDLTVNRRGEILSHEELKTMIILEAKAPLSELRGYSTHLRIISSGKAFFGMEFSHDELMDLNAQNKAIENVTGFKPR